MTAPMAHLQSKKTEDQRIRQFQAKSPTKPKPSLLFHSAITIAPFTILFCFNNYMPGTVLE